MSEKRFMWNSVDGGDNLFIKDKKSESDKLIHIKLIDGKHEFVELMKTVNDLEDKIIELEKNFEDLVNWSTEISKRNVLLNEKIARLQEEEKLYAQEILRLNELLKQYQSFKDLGGDY